MIIFLKIMKQDYLLLPTNSAYSPDPPTRVKNDILKNGSLCSGSIQEAEKGGSPWVEDQPGLHSELLTRQGYTMRPCLQTKMYSTRLE